MQQAKNFQVPPCPSHMRVLNQVWSRLILYQATVHDENKMLSSHCAWSQQLRSNWLIGSIFWKAFQYEYKWSYPQKTVSEPTHWLHVNYYRPKVKPCQDEQTLVKGAYKNQLNRVPTKLQILTWLTGKPMFQYNETLMLTPTQLGRCQKSWHTLDGSFNIDWRGLVIFDIPSVLKFKNMSSISTSDTSSWWELKLM